MVASQWLKEAVHNNHPKTSVDQQELNRVLLVLLDYLYYRAS